MIDHEKVGNVVVAVEHWQELESVLEDEAPALLELDWRVCGGHSRYRFEANLPPGYCFKIQFQYKGKKEEYWEWKHIFPGRRTSNFVVRERPLPEVVREVHRAIAEEASTPKCERSDILQMVVENAEV